jgi:hypothetical protein
VHPGKAKRRNPAAVQKEVEHAKYQEGVIKLAKKLEAAQRRAALRAQENPPDAEFSRPPRYELVGRAKD